MAVIDATGNTGYLNGEELVNRRYNLGSNLTYHDFFADVPAKEMLSLGYGRFGQDDRFFHFKGMIDEVRIYNRPLNSDEVYQLWDEGTDSTGIETSLFLPKENELKIYPNPATYYIRIFTENETQSIDFFGLDGRKMYSIETREPSKIVSINHWIKGIYIAKSNDGKFTKVVVQ